MALTHYGADYVHSYVGKEPTGLASNTLCLDALNMPHNPMTNWVGTIQTDTIYCSKIYNIGFSWTKSGILKSTENIGYSHEQFKLQFVRSFQAGAIMTAGILCHNCDIASRVLQVHEEFEKITEL